MPTCLVLLGLCHGMLGKSTHLFLPLSYLKNTGDTINSPLPPLVPFLGLLQQGQGSFHLIFI